MPLEVVVGMSTTVNSPALWKSNGISISAVGAVVRLCSKVNEPSAVVWGAGLLGWPPGAAPVLRKTGGAFLFWGTGPPVRGGWCGFVTKGVARGAWGGVGPS